MPSLGELIDSLIGTLHGHVDLPAMGSLVEPLEPDDTEATLDFGDTVGAARPNGVIEIGRELMVVSRFDPTTGVAKLTPWGRGHSSTQATAHPAGARVTVRPRFPRVRVAEAINEVVRSSCPPLFAVRDLPPIEVGAFVALGYPLPSDLIRVLRVDATAPPGQFPGDRVPLTGWRIRDVAGVKSLELGRDVPGTSVQVTAAVEPGRLVLDSEDFAATTGLNEACADMAGFGALARLVMGAELARQQLATVEANARADRVPATSGSTISRYYQTLYNQRLMAEQDRLTQQYPMRLLRRG